MSFILDALKKSESERQRNSTPGFADIQDGRDRPRPQRWLWIVGILLVVNLAVLISIFLLPATDPAERTAASDPPTAMEPSASVGEPAFSELVAEARKNRPKTGTPTTTEPQREEPATRAEAQREAPAAAAPSPAPRQSVSESHATFDDLRAAGKLQLPDLHLDVHVYSEQPADRFVFINMSKYKERANLNEGPLVKEITPDGVILEQAGTAFLLPRQ